MYADVCDYAVLHPRHKLAYFKNAGWEDEWIKTAEHIIRKEYECSYACRGNAEDGDAMGDEGVANIVRHYHDINIKLSHSACTLQQETSLNIFNNITALAKPILSRLQDELTAYLSSDPKYIDDVLSWWYEKWLIYPHLSRMALDYLMIPSMYSCLNKPDNHWTYITATSVDVEHIFSQGWLLLSHVRNHLSAQTTHAILCLRSWSLLGLVKDEDVMKVAVMKDVEGDVKEEFEDGWDSIKN